MKKWILLLVLGSSPVLAAGPKYTYPTPRGLDDEMQNVYHDIKFPTISTATIQNETVSVSSISTMTVSNSIIAFNGINAGGNNTGANSYLSLSRSDASWKIANETSLRFYEAGSYTTNPTTNKYFDLTSGGILTLFGNLQFNAPSTQGIVGTTTNDSAATGNVGQVVNSANSAGTSLGGSTVYTDIASVALTAGDWMVAGEIYVSEGGASNTQSQLFIGTVAGNNSTGANTGDNLIQVQPPPVTNYTMAIVPFEASLSGNKTYYLKAWAAYTVATPTAYGRITAWRIR